MLTPTHIYLAAIIALVATMLINHLSRLFTLEFIVRNAPSDNALTFQFFNKGLVFNGMSIKRGNIIRVTTHRNRQYCGVFVGMNEHELICVRNGNQIIYARLKDIASIMLPDITQEGPPDNLSDD